VHEVDGFLLGGVQARAGGRGRHGSELQRQIEKQASTPASERYLPKAESYRGGLVHISCCNVKYA
jgi:hypothetical protein